MDSQEAVPRSGQTSSGPHQEGGYQELLLGEGECTHLSP